MSIDVTGDSDSITISIQDTGIGIPSEDIPHLFQKFYRVDNSDTREIGGTGLGLYLCRRLAETLGGRIWVESVYQQGSTFFIELPRLDNAEARHRLAEQEAAEKSQAAALSPAKPPAVTIPVNPTVAAPAAPVPTLTQTQAPTPAPVAASTPTPIAPAPQPAATSIPVVDYQQPAPVAPAPQTQPQPQQIQTTQQQPQQAQVVQHPRTERAARPQPVVAPRTPLQPQQSIASMEQTLAASSPVNQAPAGTLSQNNYPPQN